MEKKIYAPIPVGVERIGKSVLDAAFKVHTALGPGLLESAYEACLVFELRRADLEVQTQLHVPVAYQEMQLDAGLRLDMLVAKAVIVELKAVEAMNPVYKAQLLTYLRLTGLRLGYLINFNVAHLRDGIKRMVL